ncbi:tRNA-methyltransferase non-catalytic subunit trm6MTase subunit [Tasmannia lanceolata]|uniref:tRNA-methyltransferase non-catalytic subunit trm6MTase subunit n=1 Tax=Tasmannia lanceolata TaxID=3420 RepID=UPI0040646AE2
MDSFEIDTVKAEKTSAMRRYNRIRKIASIFRYLELCIALFFLSWFSTRLPIAIRISGDYFRQLCVVLVSPYFVFFVGNVIIITLVAKSGQTSAGTSSGTDLYDEFLKNSENRYKIRTETHSPPANTPPEEEIVYEDKAVCVESRYINTDTEKCKCRDTETVKPYRRSRSENLEAEKRKEIRRELRRSETEVCPKMEKSDENPTVASYSEDLSSEEFNRKIDAFIAEQLRRFHREESLAIVLHEER